jgi:hypothetical protein
MSYFGPGSDGPRRHDIVQHGTTTQHRHTLFFDFGVLVSVLIWTLDFQDAHIRLSGWLSGW